MGIVRDRNVWLNGHRLFQCKSRRTLTLSSRGRRVNLNPEKPSCGPGLLERLVRVSACLDRGLFLRLDDDDEHRQDFAQVRWLQSAVLANDLGADPEPAVARRF